MGRIWNFIRDPLNLAVLVALGTAIGFLWNRFGTAQPPAVTQAEPPAPPASQSATAGAGSAAVNAAGTARVNIGRADNPGPNQAAAEATPPPAATPAAAGQVATAGAGGAAVNASDNAQVQISQ